MFFSAVFGIIVYFLLFPYPLGRETVARPAWAVAIPSPGDPAAAAAAAGESALARFQLGGLFGYVDAGGRFAHVEKTLFQVALADTAFVNYARLGTDWILKNTSGRRVMSFSGSGYPLLSPVGDRLFVVKADLSGIMEIDRSGDTLWDRDFPSLLTTLSVQGDLLLAGLVDGTLVLLDARGSPVTQEAVPGSRIPVVLGAALSADGRLAAVVSGIDPQLLTVYNRGLAGLEPRAAASLTSDFRREVRVSFSPDGRYVVVEGASSAGILDTGARRSSRVPLRGFLAGVSFPDGGQCAALGALGSGRADLAVVTPFVGTVLQCAFAARELFLGTIGGQLLLGVDGRLLRIDVGAM